MLTLPKTAKDITGQTFGRWTAVRYAGVGPSRRGSLWLFRCACGVECELVAGDVRRGATASCGCGQVESQVRRLTTHGRSKTPLYAVWVSMKSRCLNPSHPKYADYGGRGITVCDRWATSFEAFAADMGQPPRPGLEVERVENNGPYAPDNCRWATRGEQNRNRRDSRLYTLHGETLCLTDWAARLGVHPVTLHLRLKRGWPVEQALTRPKTH